MKRRGFRRTAALVSSVGISLGTYGLLGSAGVASAQTGSVAAKPNVSKHQLRTPSAAPRSSLHHGLAGKTLRPALQAAAALPTSYAHTYTVNNNGDTTDATPGNGVCADASNKCTLRAAIEEADADTGASAINVPSGMTVALSSPLDDITQSVQINGSGATVNGNGHQIFYIGAPETGPAPAVGITGLKITGDVNGTDTTGAIDLEDGSLVLSGVTVTGNGLTATNSYGGGIYVDYDGSLWVSGSAVSGNGAYDGGGLYIDGAANITNSTIGSNTATYYAGGLDNEGSAVLGGTNVTGNRVTGSTDGAGGIYSDGLLQITGGSIDHNALTNGGYGAGLYNDWIAQLSDVAITSNSTTDGSGEYVMGVGIYGDGSTLSLDHVTMAANKASTPNGADTYGTAIASYDDNLSVANTTISGTVNDGAAGNTYLEGGAIWYDESHMSLDNVTISDTTNTAGTNDIYGGAILTYEPAEMSGVTVTNTSNSASYISGGAIWDDAESTLNGITIKATSNHASDASSSEIDGGAMTLQDYPSTLNNVTIDGTTNLADLADAATPSTNGTSVYGGGMYFEDEDEDYPDYSASTVSITNTVSKAVGGNGYIEGGVVYLPEDYGFEATDFQVVGATVQADYAIEGGGIFADGYFQADRLTVAGVTATVLGGPDTSDTPYLDGAGLYLYYGSALTNSTVANVTGSAPSSGAEAFGVYNDDESTMTNVTMANDRIAGPADHTFWLYTDSDYETKLVNSIVSSASPSTNCGGPGTVVSAGHNIDSGHSCGFTNAGDQQNTNPKVANVADNGGLVQTAALVVGSPAINAGNNATCPPTDARGVNRPVGSACDIGAYEYNLQGYWLAASDGGVFSFGPGAHFHGSLGNVHLNAPIVGMADDPVTGGYWLVAADGGVFAFDAPYYGSMGGHQLNQPIVGMAAAPGGHGYWLVASDGGIFAFGPGAHYYGSTGDIHLDKPVVGMAADPVTGGYWMVASDGGIFAFHAPFFGSVREALHGGLPAQPVVAMAAAPFGDGYRLAASDGGVFAFGPTARFYGSMGGTPLAKPVVGMAPDDVTGGYWLVASDGGVFSFHASFYGSTGGVNLAKPIVAMAPASVG